MKSSRIALMILVATGLVLLAIQGTFGDNKNGWEKCEDDRFRRCDEFCASMEFNQTRHYCLETQPGANNIKCSCLPPNDPNGQKQLCSASKVIKCETFCDMIQKRMTSCVEKINGTPGWVSCICSSAKKY